MIFSRFSWVLFLKNKNDTFTLFYFWFTKIKNQFNTRIKYIRSDNGTEFKNKYFSKFCLQYGIQHQFTIPYNPQQNGRVERLNGTLINATKALLNDAKLSHHFWEDAINTANFIHNLLPHKGINNKIPYEIIYNTRFDYSKLKVFGCKVFFFIPKRSRSKFDNNTLPGIFLGYSQNTPAYKIYDTTNKKIILSCTVEFFENYPCNNYINFCSPLQYNLIPNNEIRENITYFDKNSYNNINSNSKSYNPSEFYNSIPIPNFPSNNISNLFNKNLINNNKIKIKRKYNKRKNNIIDHDSNNIGKYSNNIINNDNYINDSKNDRNNNNNNNYDNNNSNNNSNKNIDNHINNNIDNNIDNSIENNINTNTNNSIENNTGNNINNNNSENINKNNNLNTSNNMNNNKNNNIKNNNINMSTSTMKNITDNRQINHLYNNNYNINDNIKNYNIYTNTKRKINNYDNTISNKRPKRDIIEPSTYKEIFNLPDKKEWIDAVKKELNNMKNLEVFKTVKNISEGANLISCRWIFKYKKNAEGKIVKRKARLVAKEYTQKQGIDYHDTFAPTLKHDSIRILTTIATKNNFNIEQIDINAAYLNARLKEELYMKAPEGHG